jgi:hypothetical protein
MATIRISRRVKGILVMFTFLFAALLVLFSEVYGRRAVEKRTRNEKGTQIFCEERAAETSRVNCVPFSSPTQVSCRSDHGTPGPGLWSGASTIATTCRHISK